MTITIDNQEMYLVKRIQDPAELTEARCFGGGATADILQDFSHAEIWGTTFNHPGDDFCEVRVFNEQQEIKDKFIIDGY